MLEHLSPEIRSERDALINALTISGQVRVEVHWPVAELEKRRWPI